jgi:hypothetical protein
LGAGVGTGAGAGVGTGADPAAGAVVADAVEDGSVAASGDVPLPQPATNSALSSVADVAQVRSGEVVFISTCDRMGVLVGTIRATARGQVAAWSNETGGAIERKDDGARLGGRTQGPNGLASAGFLAALAGRMLRRPRPPVSIPG